MKRETGFYWVKYATVWRVAEFSVLSVWRLPGYSVCYYDNELEEIDERRLEHGK